MKRFLLTSVAAIAIAAPALGADLGGAPDYSAPSVEPSAATWAAYFDVHAGYGMGSEDKVGGIFDYDEDWDELVAGGAARAAYFISPSFSIQGDAWANYYNGEADGNGFLGPYDYDFEDTYAGVGGHFTYNAAPGSLVGLLASYGWALGEGEDDGFANVGVEAAHEFGAFRLYGQAGYTVGVDGPSEDADTWYGVGKLGYYFNDNMVLSGSFGYGSTDWSGADQDILSWGASFEAKPWQAPVSIYAAYQGTHWESGSGSIDVDGDEHVFLLGAKFMMNSSTIRERDQTVGLKDMNPIFGDFP